jgi:uncharacterized membrane protein YccC
MSSETVADAGANFRTRERFDASTRHALRIAAGITVPFVVGEALGWNLPFVASIFALLMLAEKQPVPTLAKAIASVVGIAAAFFAALVLTRIVLPYPFVFVLVVGLAVFAGLYAQLRSTSPIWFFFLVAVTVTPVMGAQSEGLATTIAGIMIAGMAVANLAVWFAHALFPEPAAPGLASPAPTPAISRSPRDDARIAVAGTLILIPLVLFLISNESAAIIMTMTALSILRTAGFAQGKRAVLGILLGNVIAGVVAVLAYFMIDTSASLLMLAAIMMAVALFFGERIAAGGASAPLYAGACTAALVLLGLGLSPFNDASTAFVTRVADVMLASAYTLALLALLASLYQGPRDQPAQREQTS